MFFTMWTKKIACNLSKKKKIKLHVTNSPSVINGVAWHSGNMIYFVAWRMITWIWCNFPPQRMQLLENCCGKSHTCSYSKHTFKTFSDDWIYLMAAFRGHKSNDWAAKILLWERCLGYIQFKERDPSKTSMNQVQAVRACTFETWCGYLCKYMTDKIWRGLPFRKKMI